MMRGEMNKTTGDDSDRRVLTVEANGRTLEGTHRAVRRQVARLQLQGYTLRSVKLKVFVARGRGPE